MNRVNEHEVEFTDNEMLCRARFEDAQDRGLGIQDAASEALAGMLPSLRTPVFVEYLSESTLRLTTDRRVIRVGAIVKRGGPPLVADHAPRYDGVRE